MPGFFDRRKSTCICSDVAILEAAPLPFHRQRCACAIFKTIEPCCTFGVDDIGLGLLFCLWAEGRKCLPGGG